MKAPEKLVQLHQTIYERSDDRKMLTTLIEPSASLTADVAVKFAEWTQSELYIKHGFWYKQDAIVEKVKTSSELFDYFCTHIYKPE